MMKTCLAFIVFVILFVSGCNRPNEVVVPAQPIVQLTTFNLPRLPDGEGMYGVWASFYEFNRPAKSLSPLHDEGFVKLGEFNISSDGSYLVDRDGNAARLLIPVGSNPQLLDDIVITFEGEQLDTPGEEGPGPILMGGKFQGDEFTATADISMLYVDAFQSNFSEVRGSYVFTTPTSDPADSNSGIWFYLPGTSPAPSILNLPVLPEGWRYEGWVVKHGVGSSVEYFSTGQFAKADSADFDGAGPGKGPGNGLNFPGQDFITGSLPRPNLRTPEFSFAVTVEPEPDNSLEPFFLRILTSTSAPGTMQNIALRARPSASVSIER